MEEGGEMTEICISTFGDLLIFIACLFLVHMIEIDLSPTE
jgi:hypothetical protein